MKLEDLNKSISEMTDAEIEERLRALRKNRRTGIARGAAAAKRQGNKKKRPSKKDRVAAQMKEMGFTDEEIKGVTE